MPRVVNWPQDFWLKTEYMRRYYQAHKSIRAGEMVGA
jgi:hypothetical protein